MVNNHQNSRKKASTQRNRQHLKTGLLFCGLAIILHVLCSTLAGYGYLDFISLLTTKAVAWLIRLTGLQAIVHSGINIRLAKVDWVVTVECTAIYSIIIFTSFLLVFPASIKAKGIGILFGIPTIYIANLARLLAMAWVVKLIPAYSTFFHDYIWQIVFLIGVAFMWLIWIDKVVNRENKDSVSA